MESEFSQFRSLDGSALAPLERRKATLLGSDGRVLRHAGGLEYFLTGNGSVAVRDAAFATRHPVLARAARGAGFVGMAAGSALPLMVASPAYAASPVDMQGLLPMGADNPGRFGTNWQTSIWAEQDVVTQAMLTLCATNNARPADVSECHEYALNRGQVLTLDNAWSGFQAVPPGGFLWKVDGLAPDQVAIFGRSWTPAPSGAPGTLGQGVP